MRVGEGVVFLTCTWHEVVIAIVGGSITLPLHVRHAITVVLILRRLGGSSASRQELLFKIIPKLLCILLTKLIVRLDIGKVSHLLQVSISKQLVRQRGPIRIFSLLSATAT